MERGLGRRQQRKRPKDEELQTLKPSFLRRGWGRRQPLKNFKPNQGFPPLSSPARWLRPAKVQASQVSSQLTSLSGERRGKCLTFFCCYHLLTVTRSCMLCFRYFLPRLNMGCLYWRRYLDKAATQKKNPKPKTFPIPGDYAQLLKLKNSRFWYECSQYRLLGSSSQPYTHKCPQCLFKKAEPWTAK